MDLNLAQMIKVAVDDGVCHSLADGGFDVGHFLNGGIQLHKKGRYRRAGKTLIGGAADKR